MVGNIIEKIKLKSGNEYNIHDSRIDNITLTGGSITLNKGTLGIEGGTYSATMTWTDDEHLAPYKGYVPFSYPGHVEAVGGEYYGYVNPDFAYIRSWFHPEGLNSYLIGGSYSASLNTQNASISLSGGGATFSTGSYAAVLTGGSISFDKGSLSIVGGSYSATLSGGSLSSTFTTQIINNATVYGVATSGFLTATVESFKSKNKLKISYDYTKSAHIHNNSLTGGSVSSILKFPSINIIKETNPSVTTYNPAISSIVWPTITITARVNPTISYTPQSVSNIQWPTITVSKQTNPKFDSGIIFRLDTDYEWPEIEIYKLTDPMIMYEPPRIINPDISTSKLSDPRVTNYNPSISTSWPSIHIPK